MTNYRHRNRTGERFVSASDIGRAEFCPKYLELREKGTALAHDTEARRARGNIGHDQLNERAGKDSRCYIATHLYGQDHPNTLLLRRFRDSVLLPSSAGRCFVAIYYALSPYLVKVCKVIPVLDSLIAPVIKVVILWASTSDGSNKRIEE